MQRDVDWTRNQSTTWDSLQAGDPFVLGGLLANILIHSEFWRHLFNKSRQNCSCPGSICRVLAIMVLGSTCAAEMGRKVGQCWHNNYQIDCAHLQVLPFFSKLRSNIRNKMKMRRLREINPGKYMKSQVCSNEVVTT